MGGCLDPRLCLAWQCRVDGYTDWALFWPGLRSKKGLFRAYRGRRSGDECELRNHPVDARNELSLRVTRRLLRRRRGMEERGGDHGE